MLNQFAQQVSNSRIEAGAEVMDAVNDFYKSVQQAANNGLPTAQPIYAEMKKRYAAQGKRQAAKAGNNPK